MKMALKPLLILVLSTLTSAEQANPIQKVIEMLSALQAKIMKEGEVEEKAYKEFFEWCDSAAKDKQFEVKTAQAQVEKLKATIAKAISDIDDNSELIEQLASGIATNEADLKDATLIRDKERADFEASEKELVDSIDMLDRAIGIIERNMKGSALLQNPVDSKDLNALMKTLNVVIDAASFSSHDKQLLTTLMQSKQSTDAVQQFCCIAVSRRVQKRPIRSCCTIGEIAGLRAGFGAKRNQAEQLRPIRGQYSRSGASSASVSTISLTSGVNPGRTIRPRGRKLAATLGVTR